VPARREVGGIAEHAIGAPRDQVRNAGSDVEPAAGAEIRLDGLRL